MGPYVRGVQGGRGRPGAGGEPLDGGPRALHGGGAPLARAPLRPLGLRHFGPHRSVVPHVRLLLFALPQVPAMETPRQVQLS